MLTTLFAKLAKLDVQTVWERLDDPYTIEVNGGYLSSYDDDEDTGVEGSVGSDFYRSVMDEFVARIDPVAMPLCERQHRLRMLVDDDAPSCFEHVVGDALAPFWYKQNLLFVTENVTFFHNPPQFVYANMRTLSRGADVYLIFYNAPPFTLIISEKEPPILHKNGFRYTGTLYYDLRLNHAAITAFRFRSIENEPSDNE